MAEFKYKVRGQDGTVAAYTTTRQEAVQFVREECPGGTIHRHTPQYAYMVVDGNNGDVVAYADTRAEALRFKRTECPDGHVMLNRSAPPQYAPPAFDDDDFEGAIFDQQDADLYENPRRPYPARPNPWTPADSRPDVARMEGPFAITRGEVRGVSVKGMQLFFDAKKNAYYSPDLNAYLDVSVPPRPTPKPSPKTIKAKKLGKEIAALQLDYNSYKRSRTTGSAEAKKVEQTLKKKKAELEKLRPAPVPMPLPPKEKVKLPKSPKGKLLMRFVWDSQRGLVKVYFNEQSSLRPLAEDVLEPFAKSPLTQGQLGYWAFHEDDLRAVMRAMDAVPELVYEGNPGAPDSVFSELERKLSSLDRLAKQAKRIKLEHAPEYAPMGGSNSKGQKVAYQDDGIRFLMSRERALLADDMGLGKTYQAIVAAETIVPKSEQILIIAPAAVVLNWRKDIGDFEPGVPAVVLSESQRAEGEDQNPDHVSPGNYAAKVDGLPPKERARFVICSYDSVANRRKDSLVRKYALQQEWGCVIVDEAHRAKKVDSLANQFLRAVNTKRLWLLTGTPIANRPVDLFGLLVLLQHPLGDDKARFLSEFTIERVGGEDGFEGVATNIEKLEELGNLISGTVLRRTKEQVLKSKLPTKHGGLLSNYGKVTVDLPEGLANGELSGVPEKTSAGYISRLRTELAKAKVPFTWDVALKVLDAGEKVVIFTGFTEAMKEFQALADQRGVLYVTVDGSSSLTEKQVAAALFQGKALKSEERAFAEKRWGSWFLKLLDRVPYKEWDAEELKEATERFGTVRSRWPHTISVFFGQMVSASEGITLTAADVLLFNDLDWMPTRHQQAEDRIYRLSKGGQMHQDVYIGYVLSDSWLDTLLFAQLVEKSKEIDDVYGGISGSPDAITKAVRKAFLQDVRASILLAELSKDKDPRLRKVLQEREEQIADLRRRGFDDPADRLEKLTESLLRSSLKRKARTSRRKKK